MPNFDDRGQPVTEPQQIEHVHRLESRDDHPDDPWGRAFRAVCACGWASSWMSTNACGGRARQHAAQMRRREREALA